MITDCQYLPEWCRAEAEGMLAECDPEHQTLEALLEMWKERRERSRQRLFAEKRQSFERQSTIMDEMASQIDWLDAIKTAIDVRDVKEVENENHSGN